MSDLDTGEFVSALAGTVVFGPLATAQSIYLPVQGWEFVKDVTLAFWGERSSFATSAASDVHFCLQEYDLTSTIIRSLHEQLANQDNAIRMRNQYHRALEEWIALEQQIGDAFSVPTERDRNEVRKLMTAGDLPDLLDRLGNTDMGWGGNLHIFNYLFHKISLAPLSLSETLKRYFAAHPGATPKELNKLEACHVTFSSGPRRSIGNSSYQGAVAYRLEISYSNPADGALNTIWTAVMPGSDLDLTTTSVLQQTNTILDTLQRYDRELGDANVLKALEETLKELKKILHIP